MNQPDLTQAEVNALRRIAVGSVVDSNMWADLTRKGLIERLLGGDVLTHKGKMALATAR